MKPIAIKGLATLATVLLALAAPSTHAVTVSPNSPASADFTFLGNSPTGWNVGTNTAGFLPPNRAPIHPLESPGTANWSIMPAGTPSDSFDPHGSESTPTDALPGAAAAIESALSTWAKASDFTSLGQVSDDGSEFNTSPSNGDFGDIRLGGIEFDGSRNILAHGFQPGSSATFPSVPSIGGDVHFDTAENWCDVTDPDAPQGCFDFQSVVLHELGHALGLDHSDVSNAIMSPTIAPNTAKRSLHPDDINGIQAIYGTQQIPVPSTLLLLAAGLPFAVGRGRRKLRKRRP